MYPKFFCKNTKEYNGFDGENDRDFLLKMFNKRNKDAITDAQQRKIRAIIFKYVISFVKEQARLFAKGREDVYQRMVESISSRGFAKFCKLRNEEEEDIER